MIKPTNNFWAIYFVGFLFTLFDFGLLCFLGFGLLCFLGAWFFFDFSGFRICGFENLLWILGSGFLVIWGKLGGS